MYQGLFKDLVNKYQNNEIELVVVFNNVKYDTNFYYDEQKDIFTASSTKSPNESFGSDGKTLAYYIYNRLIELRITFL